MWEQRNRGAKPAAPKPIKPVKKSIDPLTDYLVAGYKAQMAQTQMANPTMQPVQMPQLAPIVPSSHSSGVPIGSGADYTGKVQGSQIQTQMAKGILSGIGAQATPSNMSFMLAWMQAEGVNPSYYNPMGTKMPGYGGSPVTSAGVYGYPSPAAGINALVATLTNGKYNDLVQGLRQSIDPFKLALSPSLGTWVTGTPNQIGRNQYIYAVLTSSQGGKR